MKVMLGGGGLFGVLGRRFQLPCGEVTYFRSSLISFILTAIGWIVGW